MLNAARRQPCVGFDWPLLKGAVDGRPSGAWIFRERDAVYKGWRLGERSEQSCPRSRSSSAHLWLSFRMRRRVSFDKIGHGIRLILNVVMHSTHDHPGLDIGKSVGTEIFGHQWDLLYEG
jgi:hypothetical protein